MNKIFKPYCLTITASDTSGGAGLQRDLKTFHDLGVRGLSAITGITAQTDEKVYYTQPIDETTLEIQLKTLFEHYTISTVKIGLVFDRKIMDVISHYLETYRPEHVIIDPIINASDSYSFLSEQNFLHFRDTFLSNATLITPNVPEIVRLSGMQIRSQEEIVKAARSLSAKYHAWIFAKGGHLSCDNVVTDYLVGRDTVKKFSANYIDITHVHGTGCLISSAITGYLSLGETLNDAIIKAKDYFFSILEKSV